MRFAGFSMRGDHPENQDSFRVGAFPYGHFIAVSDGVGSNRYSQIGSKGFCQACYELLHSEGALTLLGDKSLLCLRIHSLWLEQLEGYAVEDCYATALLAVETEHCVTFLRLGDGFLAGVWEEETLILYDEKENSAYNYTDSLWEEFSLDQWEFVIRSKEGLRGIVASTDGLIMTHEKENYQMFANDLVNGYQTDSSEEIEAHLPSWVEPWESADDKTIALLLPDKMQLEEENL